MMKKLNKKRIVLIVITLIISAVIIAFPLVLNAVKRNHVNKVEVTVNTETSNPYGIGVYNGGWLPDPPTQLTAPTLTNEGNELRWNAIVNATGYQLYRDSSTFGDVIDGTTFTATQSGIYQVQAVGDGSLYLNSELSAAVTVTVTEPTTPVQLASPTLTNKGNVLSWNAIENATGYQLYKDGSSYQAQLSATTTTYTATESGSYQVMAIGDGTNYSNSKLSTAVTVTVTEPTTPIQLPAPYVEGTGNYLTWDPVPHATGYQLYKDGSTFGDIIVITMFTATQTGVYQVQAIGDGISYSNSSLSNSYSVTIVPRLPAPVITLNDSGYITWLPVNGAISYGVYRDDSLVATLTDFTFLYAPPVTGTYYVVANADGNTATSSLASNSVAVTTTPSNPAFNEGYEQGFNDGYDVGVSQGFSNPITIFVRPISSFLTTDLFGSISIGDVMQVLLFICLALIFLKMFAGG